MTSLSAALEARDGATPGPWSVAIEEENNLEYRCVVIPEIGREIHNSEWSTIEEYETDCYNATVIAAAPDALDWIAKALPWMKEMRLHVSLDPQHAEIEIAEIDALIAQAEGKEVGE